MARLRAPSLGVIDAGGLGWGHMAFGVRQAPLFEMHDALAGREDIDLAVDLAVIAAMHPLDLEAVLPAAIVEIDLMDRQRVDQGHRLVGIPAGGFEAARLALAPQA